MKFLLLAWKTKESNLWSLSLDQWREVVTIAKQTANKHQLDLINIGLFEENLELFFFGHQHQIEKFKTTFKQELYDYLSGISNNYKALSNISVIEDLNEEDPRLLKAIRYELISNELFYFQKTQGKRYNKHKLLQFTSPP